MKSIIKSHLPSSIRRIIHPRKLRVISLGTPKSGTTSIAHLFSTNYRYGHECERNKFVRILYRHYKGEVSDAFIKRYLKKREQRLFLDVESNCFLGYRPGLTFKAFPEFKYILTIREPLSWLDSIFNNNLNFPISNSIIMAHWHEFFFLPHRYEYKSEDKLLKENNLYPIDAYLDYWLRANKSVIETIPNTHLLILPTNKISKKIDVICKFLDIDKKTLSIDHARSNVTEKKYNILKQMDVKYIEDRINVICQDFINVLNLSWG